MGIDDSTTRAYALVGFIFYLIGLTVSMITFFMIQLPTFSFLLRFFRVPFFLFGVIISGGLTAWAWVTLKCIESGRGSKARISCLILGILGLYFGLLIGGIFFLLAYAKLGKVTSQKTPQQRFFPIKRRRKKVSQMSA